MGVVISKGEVPSSKGVAGVRPAWKEYRGRQCRCRCCWCCSCCHPLVIEGENFLAPRAVKASVAAGAAVSKRAIIMLFTHIFIALGVLLPNC